MIERLQRAFVARAAAQRDATSDPDVKAAFSWCIAQYETLVAELYGHPDDLLNARQSAAFSGYSVNYLARLSRAGQFPNRGRRNRPRYRRGDLPRKGAQRGHLPG